MDLRNSCGSPAAARAAAPDRRATCRSGATGRVRFNGTLPERWLIAQWPDNEPEPVTYWLSSQPADTTPGDLIRTAKIRGRIEHDYRELKTGLGLDHFEGRSWTGWHRHVTLVTAAHLFITAAARPESGCAGLTLYKVIHELQLLLATWTGACPTCYQKLKPLHRNNDRQSSQSPTSCRR